jgi:6-phospho-beta-glucosidase
MTQTMQIRKPQSTIRNPKVAYIGGGSAYAPGVLRAFANLKNVFNDSEVALVDINTESLDLIKTLGTKIARSLGSDLRITATTDRRAALEGADYVLTSFRVGGFEARALDERIPLQYGVIGQETVGPGGFFFALRNMAVIKELCAEMHEICPDAWLINYANPTNIIGEAVSRYSPVKALALCDGGKHDAFHVAHLLGYSSDDVEFWGLGLNHATWSTRFTIAGRDGIEMMNEAHDRIMADPSISEHEKRNFRLASVYGRLPNDYMQYYYYPEETVAEAKAAPLTRAGVIMKDLPSIFEHYQEQAAADNPVLTHARGGTGFGEFAVDVITALATNSGLIEMINRPNNGALPGLPPERVAEVPCRIDSDGATPLANGPLPSELRGLIAALAEYQSLTAETAWHAEDKAAAIRALASNPLTWKLDIDRVASMYNELAQAHARWLSPRLV